MKRKITSIAALFLVIVTLISCKKEDTSSLKFKIAGRWQLNKVETTLSGPSGSTSTITTNYSSADYFDFKKNDEDEVEIKMGSTSTVGNYLVLMGDSFNLSYNGELLRCDVKVLNETTLQFTGTQDGSTPNITKTFYLVR